MGWKDSWAESFLSVPGSLFITALTWIMQDQTMVDISLIDSTLLLGSPLNYPSWWFICTVFTFIFLTRAADSLRTNWACVKQEVSRLYCLNDKYGHVTAHFAFLVVLYIPLTFSWFEASVKFLAFCHLCLFVLPVNAAAAKLLSPLTNGGLQALMGSLINGCQSR